MITHETEQGSSKGKETDLKRRESSEGPDSHESSEDSDAIATDTDASSETDSLSQLVSEATITDYINIEKGVAEKEDSSAANESQKQATVQVTEQIEKRDTEQIINDEDTERDVHVTKDCKGEISKDTTEACDSEKTGKESKTESANMNEDSDKSVVDVEQIEDQGNVEKRETEETGNKEATDKSDQNENSECDKTVGDSEVARDSRNDDTEAMSSESRKTV